MPTKLRKKSQKQEKKVAKELNGRVTPASGALDCAKGDVRSDYFLIECKTTSKDFYSLSLDTWDKISKEALRDGMRVPVMCIDLEDGERRYAVINESDFEDCYPPAYCYESDLKVTTKSFRVKGEANIGWCYSNRRPFRLMIINWDLFVTDVLPKYVEIFTFPLF